MQIQPPILILRNNLLKTLESSVGHKIPTKIADTIVLDLTPNNIRGDFTFPVFEIAKALKADYSRLALNTAENLKNYSKYACEVGTINGYINITILSEKFYTDTLRFILSQDLLQEAKKVNRVKPVLLVLEQSTTGLPIHQPVFDFISQLYISPTYLVKTTSLNSNVPHSQVRSFLRKVIGLAQVEDCGDNVITARTQQDKDVLLQRQNKTPTPLLCQLTDLNTIVRNTNPKIIIFSLNTSPQYIREFLEVAHNLQIFKKEVSIKIINNSDIENESSSNHFNSIKNLYDAIEKNILNKSNTYLRKPIVLKNTDIVLAKIISYAPEALRQSLIQTSPDAIIRYCQSLRNFASTHKTSNQILLQAIYKIFGASLRLIYPFQQSLLK